MFEFVGLWRQSQVFVSVEQYQQEAGGIPNEGIRCKDMKKSLLFIILMLKAEHSRLQQREKV